jgi:hypothetical protein
MKLNVLLQKAVFKLISVKLVMMMINVILMDVILTVDVIALL